MRAWLGYFPVAGRLVLAAALAAAALAALAGALRGRKARRRVVQPPRPGRRGLAELAALLERARSRPYSRDLAAERLRALARDLVALRLGSGDAAARAALDEATARQELLASLETATGGSRGGGSEAAGRSGREAAADGGGGALDLDPRLLAFLAEDHLAKPADRPARRARTRARRGGAAADGAEVQGAEVHGAESQGAEGRRSYLERLDEALRLLEDYGEDLQGERP